MKNEVAMKPFPENLLSDLGREAPAETPDDFTATFMYVLYCVAPPRDVKIMIMRYKSGKSFDEIAESLGISRQRAAAVVQEVLGRMTGDHADMLAYGIKQYMENVLADRVKSITNVIEVSEREAIRAEAYAKGVVDGKREGAYYVNEDFEDITIEKLGMTTRTYNACEKNNLRTLADILRKRDGIIDCRTFGAKCFHELCAILTSMNINPATYFPRTIEKFGMEEK